MNKLALLAVVAVLTAPIVGAVAATGPGASDRSAALAGERASDAWVAPAPEGSSATASLSAPSPPELEGTQQFDRSKFVVTVYPNGTAVWTFQYFQQLSQNETERQQFRDYADRFESQETDLYTSFVDRASALTATGRNLTGRDMTASGFHREAYVEEGINYVGVVEMSFRWSAFAEQRGEAVVVADVFEGGFYIGATQTLVFEPGGDLAFESVAPEGTLSGTDLQSSDSVTWQGEREFSDQRPRVVLRPADSITSTNTTESGGNGGSGGDGADGGSGGDGEPTRSLPWMIVLGLIAVLAGGGALAAYRRNSDGSSSPPVATASSDGGGGAAAADATASGGNSQPAAAPEPAVPDEELLTDEDRVVNLLEENGGRMKQVNIVDETGWSKSKVSMLLSDMEEEGEISKLRVGRENIISLQGHEPDAAGSPFEDE